MTQSRVAARAFLASVAQEARDGHLRLRCPFCDGGPEAETSLVLTIGDDGTFYCCHRASCGEAGQLGSASAASLLASRGSKVTRPKDTAYRGELLPLRFLERTYANTRWLSVPRRDPALLPADVGLFTEASESFEIWVVRNARGGRIGVQTRTMVGGKKSVRSYKDDPTSGPLYHALFTGVPTFRVWVVEDALSAAVLRSWNEGALALLGTYLDTGTAIEVCDRLGPSEIIVALDPGAEGAAELVSERFRAHTSGRVSTVYLNRDIKDMSYDQVGTLLASRGSI